MWAKAKNDLTNMEGERLLTRNMLYRLAVNPGGSVSIRYENKSEHSVGSVVSGKFIPGYQFDSLLEEVAFGDPKLIEAQQVYLLHTYKNFGIIPDVFANEVYKKIRLELRNQLENELAGSAPQLLISEDPHNFSRG